VNGKEERERERYGAAGRLVGNIGTMECTTAALSPLGSLLKYRLVASSER